ncbi:MAG: HlyD family efflux transporter periplasmic adaptor subunit [Bacteroidales bacterium]|nr:HlyD family efflux transporter periplasmic adaptor subunit [Bacteroidales bacterium]
MKKIFRSLPVKISILILVLGFGGCNDSSDRPDAYGNFETDELRVYAEANGRILWLSVEEGMRLDSGQITAMVDTTDLYLKKVQVVAQIGAVRARAGNVSAQADVQEQQKENLLIDYRRLEKLFSEGAATRKQLDDAEAGLRLIEKQIEATQSQYDLIAREAEALETQVLQLDEAIRKCSVVNPLHGTVLETYSEAGEVTSYGKPLYKIARTNEMILRVYISGAQLPSVRTGQQVHVLIDRMEGRLDTLPGTVSWIAQTAEFTPKIIQTREERVNLVYAVRISVKNDGSLKVGMPGEAVFVRDMDLR